MHDFTPLIERKLALLPTDAGWRGDAAFVAKLRRLALASDFALATLASQPLARLKWLAHLVRSDGELEAGLDAKGRYKLSRWPQSEREFPKHFRIATVMLKQAHTLDEIATQGGASSADVANFINAYNALGYIDREDQSAAAGDSRGGGLFGRAKKTTAAS